MHSESGDGEIDVCNKVDSLSRRVILALGDDALDKRPHGEI